MIRSKRLKDISWGLLLIFPLLLYWFSDGYDDYWGFGFICIIVLGLILLYDDLSKVNPRDLTLRLPIRIIAGLTGIFMFVAMIYLKISFPEPIGIFEIFMDIFYFSFCFFLLYLAIRGYVFKKDNQDFQSPNINN